jgi:tetratricopeptide (TPR) repeat protein
MARCFGCGRRAGFDHARCDPRPVVAPAPLPISGPEPVFPGYQVERALGFGGFGSVWAARRQSDNCPVAIKLARHDRRPSWQRLEREGEALALVGPPQVPELFASQALADGTPYLVMERLVLTTLAERMEQLSSPMELGEIQRRVMPLLGVLETMHEKGVVHRDLKPENIFSSMDPPLARLIDFGLARGEPLQGAPNLTTHGMILGTADYMSPEQCEGAATADHRADLYSLGVLLYELLTGRPPFFGPEAELAHAHRAVRPRPPSESGAPSAAFDEIVLRCLAKEPQARFQSAALLAAALEEVFADAKSHPPAPLAAAPAAAAVASPTLTQRRHRQAMGLVFLEVAESDQLAAELAALGGQLASLSRSRAALAFGESGGSHPLRVALRAAEQLLARKVADRAVVDVAIVEVQERRAAPPVLRSPVFFKRDRYPTSADPQGILLTAAAAGEVPELATEKVAGREDFVRVVMQGSLDATTVEHRGALFGRDELMASLLDRTRRAVEKRIPSLTTVLGDTGLGKTHLAAALASTLRGAFPHLEIMHLRATQVSDGLAGPTMQLLLRRLLDISEEPADRGRALLRERLGELAAEVWPVVAFNLGWLSADAAELGAQREAPRALRTLAARAAAELLRRMAALRPVVLLIDDAHLADAASLDALEQATFAGTRSPIGIFAFARPTLEVIRPVWGGHAASAERVELSPLGREHATALARQLLKPAENVPRTVLDRIYERTGGNPLLVVELCRTIQREGLVRQHGRTFTVATDELERLPDSALMHWLAGRELAQLPPALAAHARLCALLGQQFELGELEGVGRELEQEGLGNEFPLDAGAGVRQLASLGLLVQGRDRRFRFRHPGLREATAESVPAALARPIHAATVRYYQQAHSLADEERLPKLAHHAERSGLAEQAAEVYLALGDRLRSRHAYLDADTAFSHALRLLGSDDSSGRLAAVRGRGMMRYRMGRYDEALHDFAEARALARGKGARDTEVEVLLELAMVFDWQRDFHRSREMLGEAEQLAGERPSSIIEAQLLLARGRTIIRFGDWAAAVEVLERAAARAEALGEQGYETLVISFLLLGAVLATIGRTDDAEAIFQRALRLCDEHTDDVHRSAVIRNRALLLWTRLNKPDRAIADMERYLELVRDLGLIESECGGMSTLAEVHYYTGALEQAMELLERAFELERRQRASLDPYGLVLKARILWYRGETADARTLVDNIRAEQARLREAGQTDGFLLPSDAAVLCMVDLAVRQASDAEWDALETEIHNVGAPIDLVEVQEARAISRWRGGDRAGALSSLERARAGVCQVPHVIERRIEHLYDEVRGAGAPAAQKEPVGEGSVGPERRSAGEAPPRPQQ